jgi:ribose-phosphate pyrophosphokinase
MAVKIFSGRATVYLAEKIAHAYGEPLGKVEYKTFSDGEMSPYIGESVRGHDVFIIQSTFAQAENFMD